MNFRKPPGIEDIFPDRIPLWNHVTGSARDTFRNHNFREIIIPIMEFTDVFRRGIGDETDIVSKEMFTFEDRGGRSLTLRPEGTASVVRAYCENGEYNRLAKAKLFYIGPMFRAEKPQRGRLRQFNQFGAELFGDDTPWHDYEIIAMVNDITKRLGIPNYSLLVNSIGCPDDRAAYVDKLSSYYRSHADELCKSCRERLRRNPMRLLDCKEESCTRLKKNAPRITDFLCGACTAHHSTLLSILDSTGITYTEDPYLVRGLDYYSKTTFEYVTDALGGQNAFAAGGRYNSLVEHFGGKPKPAVGFAAGIERLCLLLEDTYTGTEAVDCFIINLGRENIMEAASLAASLRESGFSCDLEYGGGSFKSQMKKCERENARTALVIDDSSRDANRLKLLDIEKREETEISFDILYDSLHTVLNRDE
ncbi:MAG: histidine--tRNA ligase [Spirochaetota bacterium]